MARGRLATPEWVKSLDPIVVGFYAIQDGLQEARMIRAECHAADNARAIDFDATPWFEAADPESIVRLARRDWSSQAVADALSVRPGYERLREVIAYARDRLRAESREDPLWPTFACRVSTTEALAWLETHRPDVAAKVRRGEPADHPGQ
jgi:hypothetical protein